VENVYRCRIYYTCCRKWWILYKCLQVLNFVRVFTSVVESVWECRIFDKCFVESALPKTLSTKPFSSKKKTLSTKHVWDVEFFIRVLGKVFGMCFVERDLFCRNVFFVECVFLANFCTSAVDSVYKCWIFYNCVQILNCIPTVNLKSRKDQMRRDKTNNSIVPQDFSKIAEWNHLHHTMIDSYESAESKNLWIFFSNSIF